MTDAADDFDAYSRKWQRSEPAAPAAAPAPAAAAPGTCCRRRRHRRPRGPVRPGLVDAAPAPAPPPRRSLPRLPVPAPVPATCRRERRSDKGMYERLGGIVRLLHDSLRELGYDKALTEASSQITDAQDRLEYVATLTEQAANKVLNTLDDGMPAQDKLSKQAKDMGPLVRPVRRQAERSTSSRRWPAIRASSRSRVGSDRSGKGAPAGNHDGPGLPGHHRPADQESRQRSPRPSKTNWPSCCATSAPAEVGKAGAKAGRAGTSPCADVRARRCRPRRWTRTTSTTFLPIWDSNGRYAQGFRRRGDGSGSQC
jgi:hypothetical protein